MFAYRSTFIIKFGREGEALELLKEDAGRYHAPYAKVRCYTPSMSPRELVWELVVETEVDRSKFYADHAGPENDAVWKKFTELVEKEISGYRWKLTELT
jgi:hypothetical protein